MKSKYQQNYKPPFARFVKKAHKPLAVAIEDEVEIICDSPEVGIPKVGDLLGIWVHKFKFNKQEYLIAYRPPSPEEALKGAGIELLVIDFFQVGPHENFYADLKKYLKS
ncbi:MULTISPECIES: type II toxin-antitoxin system RelE/ParE family toxin [Pseudomonas]|jgi:hypothetical protein|uniref:Type II toxin-antitoxin system RelE/ParE family toxin n=1 Tax=Pseudomonas arsenicoxydans TaxID=702115 RepID=A0A502GXL8_9PSED|nr:MULTISPECIES: type II toxin-antitoxin system RelE/ParE family toxin [Pseudomonas]NBB37431.1 type II toxin-antitoxin system RelE/ParE family toxin [Pseudomonas sp. BC115LW]TPG65756.1 type II toxin-antitoxin system RelE/ParE family toxin [Pseudomonas arsenicoxydans]